MAETKKTEKLKIAALADIHVHETSAGAYKELFAEISQKADLLVLCGDLTDLGSPKEAEVLAGELLEARIPVIGVLGNHDYESDKQEEVANILKTAHMHVLEGTEYVFEKNGKSYGFTGVKGFGGGFRPYMWGRFGELEQKEFYDAVAKEVQALENGINKLRDLPPEQIVVLMHFSPIRDTLNGEIPELYPFLGSTRLEEVVDRFNIAAVIHGHAHFGSHKGKTEKGIPVYNVAYPLMKRIAPTQPYAILEI